MKTYKQRTESILQKTNTKTKQRKAVIAGLSAAGLSVAATALALILFLPYPTAIPSVTAYKDSDYYSVIKKLNEISYEAPRYKNNFEKWTAFLGDAFSPSLGGSVDMDSIKGPTNGSTSIPEIPETGVAGGAVTPDAVAPSEPSAPNDDATAAPEGAGNSTGNYEETTDNQVEGVIEADLLKRTDKYAFYLTANTSMIWNENGYYESVNGHLLRVYSIAGENSAQVEELVIPAETGIVYISTPEMYLSEDATTLTVISDCYKGKYYNRYTMVASIDTSDPTNLVETSRVYLSGNYVSSRLVNGALLVVNSYTVSDPDFSNEASFLPQYGTLDNMQSVSAEDIVCSDIAITAKYTVVTKLDEKTLEVEDSEALLSYSQEVYVSATNVFLTQSYAIRKGIENEQFEEFSMTEISCVSYAGEGLELKGTFSVNGSVKNQYSMDEYEGVLRVATTYRHALTKEYASGDYSWWSTLSSETNANLYCIDLTSFETVGKVEKFAPKNETVESVRFNGTKAYVCTAVVITFKDPVFCFDLSDMQNITWTDTGTIDGYSTSLIDFGHGYLVGIGYNDRRELKIEVYTQGEGVVDSVCSYELDANFSENYKSYLIDRENGLIGLGVYTYMQDQYTAAYLLLSFENGEFTRMYLIPHEGTPAIKRAFYEEGYLYLFGYEFKVVAI